MNRDYLLAGGAVICWSSIPPISKLMLNDITPAAVLFLTSTVASLSLLIYNIARGNLKKFAALRPIDWLKLIWMGFVGYFIYNAAYYLGIDRLSAQDACVINYLWPLMTVIFSCIILKERFTAAKGIAAVLSFAGVAIVATKGDFSGFANIDFIGVLCCLTAAVSYGVYSAFNKKYDYDQEPAMFLYFAITAVCSGIWTLSDPSSFFPFSLSGFEFAGVLWIGIVVSAVGYLIWNLALNRGDTAKISNLAYITPFLAMVLSCLILKEPFDPHTLLGLLLIISGIIVQMKGGKRKSQ